MSLAKKSNGATPTPKSDVGELYFDCLIIGAGISGLNAAYRIQYNAPGNLSYVILENRSDMGGTWDLFKYPGIRSDSDIFTFGFSWSPWTFGSTIGTGPQIKEYLHQSTAKTGIDQNILYEHSVETANWSSKDERWTLEVRVKGQDTLQRFSTRFILLGTGYYDYNTPLKATIPGIDDFKGKVIHPQFWPTDYDYADKEIAIIGSGATAITILPSITEKAKKVTMLQRSPTYIATLRNRTLLTWLVFTVFSAQIAHRLSRMFYLCMSHFTTWLAQTHPNLVKWIIRRQTQRALPPDLKWDPNFKPRYEPWDQRFCACPNGDYFAALRTGKATVVTDTIEKVTEKSIELTSGQSLYPDIIVTAPGLKIKFGGGIRFFLDDEEFNVADKYAWKAAMLQDVPNLVFITGYERASWTLGADVSAQLFVRLLKDMEKTGATVATPRVAAGDENMPHHSMLSLKSTYLKHADTIFPKGGIGQWAPKRFYFSDMTDALYGDIRTGMVLS